MKPQRSKPERLADVVDRGQRIANLLADPVVIDFLDDAEATALESVIAASVNMAASPDQVRAAGIRYGTIRQLRRSLSSAAADGVRVLKNMSEI
jgi:hypothetical protein